MTEETEEDMSSSKVSIKIGMAVPDSSRFRFLRRSHHRASKMTSSSRRNKITRPIMRPIRLPPETPPLMGDVEFVGVEVEVVVGTASLVAAATESRK